MIISSMLRYRTFFLSPLHILFRLSLTSFPGSVFLNAPALKLILIPAFLSLSVLACLLHLSVLSLLPCSTNDSFPFFLSIAVSCYLLLYYTICRLRFYLVFLPLFHLL